MSNLIDNLIEEGWLKTPRIIDAFRKIKRKDFLPASLSQGGPENKKHLSELNEALPIGYGQTISQPLVVAFMLEKLEPDVGDRILDIGSGSGWTTALLAEIVAAPKGRASPERRGQKGKVIAFEIIPELMEFGKKNVEKYGFVGKGIVEFICDDGSNGYMKQAPYNRILASATAKELPQAWKKQLEVQGRIVMPIGSSIWIFVKKSSSLNKETRKMEDEFEQFEYPGFAFVPLISRQ